MYVPILATVPPKPAVPNFARMKSAVRQFPTLHSGGYFGPHGEPCPVMSFAAAAGCDLSTAPVWEASLIRACQPDAAVPTFELLEARQGIAVILHRAAQYVDLSRSAVNLIIYFTDAFARSHPDRTVREHVLDLLSYLEMQWNQQSPELVNTVLTASLFVDLWLEQMIKQYVLTVMPGMSGTSFTFPQVGPEPKTNLYSVDDPNDKVDDLYVITDLGANHKVPPDAELVDKAINALIAESAASSPEPELVGVL